jgi:hypothetical protein
MAISYRRSAASSTDIFATWVAHAADTPVFGAGVVIDFRPALHLDAYYAYRAHAVLTRLHSRRAEQLAVAQPPEMGSRDGQAAFASRPGATQVIRMIRICAGFDLHRCANCPESSNVAGFVGWIRTSIRHQIPSPCLRVFSPYNDSNH